MSGHQAPGPSRGGMQPGTLQRAVLLGIMLFAVLAGVAWMVGANKPRTAIEEYIRQGERGGAAALMRDIQEWAPTGADAGPAVQRLTAIGFSCAAPGGISGDWICVVRVPERERRLTTIQARLRVLNGVMSGVAAEISVRNVQ